MANSKRDKMKAALKNLGLPQGEDILSKDLAKKVGSLEKITIRLDSDVVAHFKEKAKSSEDRKGYQALINEQLKKLITKVKEVREESSMKELGRMVAKINDRLDRLEHAKPLLHKPKAKMSKATKKLSRPMPKSGHVRISAAKKKV